MVSIVGKRYNKLTVIRKTSKKSNNSYLWECKCDCGNITLVKKWNITSGNTKSCGCLKLNSVKKMNRTNTTHGMSSSKLYRVWESMKRRCDNSKTERYASYGGKGITYCKEWSKFENFYRWAKANGYEEGLSFDRIDVNGNYEPSNCRWIPLKRQAYNKTNSRKVSYNNKELTIAELANKTGKPYHLIYQRIIKLGWDVKEAIK